MWWRAVCSSNRKKDLTDLLAQLRAVRVELDFARERKKAAEDVIHFGERQKVDLQRQIEQTKEDLKILEAEENSGKEDGVREIKVARSLERRPLMRSEDVRRARVARGVRFWRP